MMTQHQINVSPMAVVMVIVVMVPVVMVIMVMVMIAGMNLSLMSTAIAPVTWYLEECTVKCLHV